MIGLPICCPVVRALIPGRSARVWASDTLCSRRSSPSESASLGSGDVRGSSGARVAVTVTGSIHTVVRSSVTSSVAPTPPATATSRASGANPGARPVTWWRPAGSSANRKPPSARVSATRCNSATTTTAPATGRPSRSATRPESVSPPASSAAASAVTTSVTCLSLLPSPVLFSPLPASRPHRRDVEVAEHPVERRQLGRLEPSELRELLVEPIGQLLEHLLLLLRGRGIRALHHRIEREQLIVDLNGPVERGLVGVSVRLRQPAAHGLELAFERVGLRLDTRRLRPPLGPLRPARELLLGLLDALHRGDQGVDPVVDAAREGVLRGEVREGRLHAGIVHDGERLRVALARHGELHVVASGRRHRALDDAFVQHHVLHFLRRRVAQVPDETVGAPTRGADVGPSGVSVPVLRGPT